MTLFERVLGQAERWLVDLDQARDRAALFIARYGGSPQLDTYLDQLEDERAKHLMMMEGLEVLRAQNHPALLLQVRPPRPQMLKATLPADHRRRRTSPRVEAAK